MSTPEQLITENLDIWSNAIKPRAATGRGRGKGKNSKHELYGIKKLRELILELAVRGLLVPQDSNDEPASALLEKIAKEKSRLIKEGKIKKQKPLPEICEEEMPYKPPTGWEWTHLGDIGEIFNGNSISASVKETKYTNIDTGLPYIATKDVGYGWQELDYANGVSIPEEEPNFKIAHKGSVLICAEGGSAGKKCGITKHDICFGNKLFATELYGDIEPNYLLANYLSPNFFAQFSEKMTGIIGGISLAKLKLLLIPIPSIEEQHRIVAKVDELMVLCDQLEQQTETSLAAHQTLVKTVLAALSRTNVESDINAEVIFFQHFDTLFTTEHSIDQLKQTILQLAVMGKLVPQNPNDEPALQLLKKISAEKAKLIKEGKIRKQKPLPEINDEEVSFNSPDGWAWSRMGDLAQYQKGYAFKSKDYLDCGLMITKIQNLTENHIQNSVYIAPERALEFAQYLLCEGDIVMTTVGSWFSAPISAVGRSFLINKLFDHSLLNQNAVRIRPWKELDPMYLFTCINSQIFKNYLVQEAQGTANQASITQESIKNFLICVPPKAEQHRIVTKVDELMALCDQLKKRLIDTKTIQLHLADTIVEKAVA